MRAALFLLLLVLPIAYAADVRFTVSGNEVRYVNPGATLEGTLHFTPTPGATNVRISSPNIDEPLLVIVGQNCCAPSVRLRMNEQITLHFQEMVSGTIQERSATLTFGVDNTPPSITDIDINGCSVACTYGNREILATWSVSDLGSDVPVDGVTATLNGVPLSVTCAGTTGGIVCEAPISGNGDAELVIHARDVAGNVMTETRPLRYDVVPPTLIEGPAVVGGTTNVPGGFPVRVTALVQEEERATITLVVGEERYTGRCERDQARENLYACTADFTPANEQASVPFTVLIEDGAGNTRTVPMQIIVFESDAQTAPSFWTVSARSRNTIDPHTWAVLDKLLIVDLHLVGSSAAIPILIQVKSCSVPGLPTGVLTAQNVVVRQQLGSRNVQLDMNLRALGTELPAGHQFFTQDITCELDIRTRVGTTIFTNPETKTISFRPRIIESRIPPPQEMKQLRKEESERKIRDEQEKLILMQRAFQAVQFACGASPTFQAAAMLNTYRASAFAGVPEPSAQAQGTVYQTAAEMSSDAGQRYMDKLGGLCNFATCRAIDQTAYGQTLINNLPGLGSDSRLMGWMSAIGAADAPHQLIDPYKSEIVAWATLCGPAVMYHRQAQLNAQCEYHACITTMDVTAATPEECAANRDYMNCRLRYGGAWNFIPYANMYESVLTRAKEIVSNPLSALGLAASAGCWLGTHDPTKIASQGMPLLARVTCGFVTFGDRLNKNLNMVQAIMDEQQNLHAMFSSSGDYCRDAESRYEDIVLSRTPPHWSDYCNIGFCSFVHNNREFIVTDNGIFQRVEQLEGTGQVAGAARAQQALYGGLFAPYPGGGMHCTEDWCDVARERLESYQQRVEQEAIRLLPNFQTLVESANTVSGTEQEIRDTRQAIRMYESRQQAIASTMRSNTPEESNIDSNQFRSFLASASRCGDSEGANCDHNVHYNYHIEFFNRIVWPIDTSLPAEEQEAQRRMRQEYFDEHVLDLLTMTIDIHDREGVLEILEGRLQLEREEWNKLKQQALALQYHAEYSTLQGAVRRTTKSMLSWARTGRFFQTLGVVDWNTGAVGEIAGGLQRTIDFFSAEERIVGAVCENRGGSENYQRTFQEVSGGLGAHITAVSSIGPSGYQYRIDYFTATPTGSDGTGYITLKTGSQRQHIEDFPLTVPRTRSGAQALAHETTTSYTYACITYPQPIRNYFPVTVGADANSRELCTRIESVAS